MEESSRHCPHRQTDTTTTVAFIYKIACLYGDESLDLAELVVAGATWFSLDITAKLDRKVFIEQHVEQNLSSFGALVSFRQTFQIFTFISNVLVLP